MPSNMKIVAYLLTAAVLSALPNALAAAGRRTHTSHLNDAQMRAIAMAAVRASAPGALRLPEFELVREETQNGYVFYEGLADTPGSVHEGFYVVDPRTGDVWDGVSECGEIDSAELQALKVKLRAQIGLSARRYGRIRRRGPMCDQPKYVVPEQASRHP